METKSRDKSKEAVIYYEDESDLFCWCGQKTYGMAGHDDNPGHKWEIRKCPDCGRQFKLIYC